MVLQTIISIEPDPGTNMQLRSHFLGALPQIGADQGHEHWTEGKGPCPRLLGQCRLAFWRETSDSMFSISYRNPKN